LLLTALNYSYTKVLRKLGNTSKDYASEVSSYTKGLGTFMVKPCGYQITKGGYSDNTRMEEKDKLLFMFEKSVSSK
ncbi:hypothetical protein, partial [Bacteroides uniformis]